MKKVKYFAVLFLMSALPMTAFGMFRPFVTASITVARTTPTASRMLSTKLGTEFNEKEYKEAKRILSQKASQHKQKVAKKGNSEATVICKDLLKNTDIRNFIARESIQIRAKQLIAAAKELDRKQQLLDKYFPKNN